MDSCWKPPETWADLTRLSFFCLLENVKRNCRRNSWPGSIKNLCTMYLFNSIGIILFSTENQRSRSATDFGLCIDWKQCRGIGSSEKLESDTLSLEKLGGLNLEIDLSTHVSEGMMDKFN